MPFPDRSSPGLFVALASIAAFLSGVPVAPVAAQSVRLTVPEENFRKEPRVASGNKLATVLEGTVMSLERAEGRWRQVTLEGWVWKPSVSADEREGMDLVVSKAGGENLREAADAKSRRVAVLERGMLLESVEESGNWVRVRRTAWIWGGSVSETSVPAAGGGDRPTPARPTDEAAREDAVPVAPSGGVSLPDRLVVREAPVRLLVSPEGDTLATLLPGSDVAVLSRQGEWARVRIEGWLWEPSTLPSDSAAATDSLTAADLKANPEQYVGRRVLWSVQYVSLERAEAVRTDFYEGEPFLLARPLDRSQGFVYIAVPPELLPEVERLRPLETIEVLGRVRTGRSALMGVPILDLLALR